MKLNRDKVKTLVGFAIKSRNIVFGCDDILAKSKSIKLILVSKNLSESSMKKIKNMAKSKNILIYFVDSVDIEYFCLNKSVKVLAIIDDGLASGIKNEFDLVDRGGKF